LISASCAEILENQAMTERKPPGVSFETWIEKQIRDAQERGEFDNLPGAGKPIPDLGKPHNDLWWVSAKMRREKLSFLPPALAVRKAAEDARAAVSQARSESQVRDIVAEVNDVIRQAIRRPIISGPQLTVMPFELDRVLAEWRAERAAAAAVEQIEVEKPAPAAPPVRKIRWWRRNPAD
jgi:hypothetical protein